MSAFGTVKSAASKSNVADNKITDVFSNKVIQKKDELFSLDEVAKIKEAGIKLSLVNSTPNGPVVRTKLGIMKKRFEMMEKWLRSLRDPVDGVQFTDRRKFFDINPSSASGAEIVAWILQNCKCIYRTEAKQIFQSMFLHGYLIPTDVSTTRISDEIDAFYTFQADFFFASRFWDASDFDYVIFLLRRSSKNGGQMVLNKEEVERFYLLQKSFSTSWKSVVHGSEVQKIYLNSLEKKERRLYELREYAFWRTVRPLSTINSVFNDILKDEAQLKKKQMNEDEYTSILSGEGLADFCIKKVGYLQAQANMYRKEISAASKSIIKYCEAWLPLDQMLVQRTNNPWYKDENANWSAGSSDVGQHQVYLWTTSFRDLLADSIGLQYFTKFMEKDLAMENLLFYLACTDLEKIQGRMEYFERARRIFDQFIEYESPNEVNINANMRNSIIEKFKSSDPLTLDISIFAGASEHVYVLMLKDKFPKFCTSEVVKEMLMGYVPRKTPLVLTTSITGEEAVNLQASAKKAEPSSKSTKAKSALDDDDDDEDEKKPRFKVTDRFVQRSTTVDTSKSDPNRRNSEDSLYARVETE